MKISIRKFKEAFSMPWLPFLMLIGVFSSNILTIAKSAVVFLLVMIYAKKYYAKLFDANLVVIFLFLVSYFFLSLVDASIKTIAPPALLVMPPIMYICGKLLAYKSRDSAVLVTSFLFIGLALASMTLLAIWSNFIVAGFEQGSRSINVRDGGEDVSATVLGGLLIILISFGGIIFSVNKSFGLIRRTFVMSLFLLSLLAAVRLGSRTLLFVGAVCFLVAFIHNSRTHSLIQSLLIVIIALAVGYLFYDYLSNVFELDLYFRDRLDSSEFGASTAGGRLERWFGSLDIILSSPFGWSINQFGYAHNLWLDTARNGGWIPFVFLVVLTVLFLLNLKGALNANKSDSLFTTFAVCLSTGFMLLFMVEPILDGFIYVFSAFLSFFGVVSARRFSSMAI